MSLTPSAPRKWWINRQWSNLGKMRPKQPGDAVLDSRRLRLPHRLFQLSIELDWTSANIYLWLGWPGIGFHLYHLIPTYHTDWNMACFDQRLSSGLALSWGAIGPVTEGGLLARHQETVFRWISPSPDWQQISIAGEVWFREGDHGRMTQG